MSTRTVLNGSAAYKGLVEQMAIPAEVVERDGRRYAISGSSVPIHCCSQEEISERSASTHHYCDVFTDEVLAPLGELAYVRLDAETAEKVFLNRSKRILLTSSDGRLAQWRSAPTFESANVFVAGAPVADKQGRLVSVVTAKRGNHYAVSNAEGEGGYFETSKPWEIYDVADAKYVYADKTFETREQLREHVSSLPPPVSGAPRPLLLRGRSPRVALVDDAGRQLVHIYLGGVLTDIEYL